MINLLAALLLAAAGPVFQAGPATFHAARPKEAIAVSELTRSAARVPAAAHHDLPALSPGERSKLLAKDSRKSGVRQKVPAVKIGISRSLPGGVGFSSLPSDLESGSSRVFSGGLLERSADGALTWTVGFASEGAGAIRLRLSQARLPEGSRVYFFSANGEVHGPYRLDRGIRPEGFWTNTIYSSEGYLQVQLPPSAAGFSSAKLTVSDLVHIEHPIFAPRAGSAPAPQDQSCFVDAMCVTTSEFPNIDDATHAIAQLTFEDAGDTFVCSGGLLNDTNSSFIPYFLTANHCFDNQSAATSLEAVWNYLRPSCDGPEPSPAGFPRTLGSTLLATDQPSDFTFLELSEDPPDGAVYLGWTTDDIAHAGGTLLYRVSCPDGRPQFYTQEQVSANPTITCDTAPQGDYVYEKDVVGGTAGGSSGSPLYTEDLQVVGQLGGACGTNTDDDCDSVNNYSIDGAFAVTYSHVQPWLSPTPGGCTPGSTTLCLNDGRFRVSVTYRTNAGATGPGQAIPLTSDTGYFWFFNPANIELVVKVLDACGVNGHFWVFGGGLTNVNVVLTVTDTNTGATKTYTNPLGTPYQPLQDTSAFVCP